MENRIEGVRAAGRKGGNGELVFNGTEFHLGMKKKFWRRIEVMAAQQHACT